MRILVTGAAGRIGSHVVLELARHGHTVKALDRKPLPKEVREVAEAVYADMTDPLAMLNAVAGCDALAHLAAIPAPTPPPMRSCGSTSSGRRTLWRQRRPMTSRASC